MQKVGNSHWLTPWEQDDTIRTLVYSAGDLIKWSANRDFPLKSGGLTDIYINLRNMRNDPKVAWMLAKLYAGALMRLGAEQFVEVPSSVSGLAALISHLTGLPYVTIREQTKAGRVESEIIGNLVRGKRTIIIDDVVTDGASKLEPIKKCLAAVVDLGPLVVLVDRQQGWKKTFEKNGIDIEVWSAFTLHDVRKYMIEHRIIERCDQEVEKKNPIILALDGKSWEEYLPLIDVLRRSGCILKANDLMFWEGVESLIPNLQVYGRVMADLKLHDIGNTVENVLKRLHACPPWALTVHASGGEEMMKKAVGALAGTPTKILAVTVLTSINPETCKEIYQCLPIEEVRVLAAIAKRAGVHGFVCSPQEVAELKKLYPEMLFVIPGVRSLGAAQGDQQRVDTPEATIANGANHIVMGRQITDKSDPVAEVNLILKELKIELK